MTKETAAPVAPAGLTGPPLARVLLNPSSIALIGASDDPRKTTGRPLAFLRAAGYAGSIYPINPRRDSVQGERAWPSLAALPEVPEHAFILTGTEIVEPALRECAQAGVKIATVLASGFGETGAAGLVRELALAQMARAHGMRLLGPSSLGIVSPRAGLMLTANAAFAERDLPQGQVFVASHSGSMIGALVSRGKARGVGFAGLVSVGGEADLSLGEICAATLDDPVIEGYLLFLESLRHGRALRAFAIEAARRGKPVIAYKLGRSQAAAEMAATHTGALAGEDDVAQAFFRDCAIARVGVLDALLESFPLARRIELRERVAPCRVGVVTTTGGGAAMAVDQLGIRDVIVEQASAQTMAKLAQAGVDVAPGRVLDLTLAGTRYEVMKATIETMLAAPEFDLVLAVVGSSARFNPQLAVRPIIDCATHAKPLAAFLVPDAPEGIAALTAAGVPCFRSPESCADSIAAVYARRVPALMPPWRNVQPTVAISEADAYELLAGLGVPHAPAVVGPLAGQPEDEALQLPFDYPVALKVCSAHIPHKTEVGGVLLNVRNRQELQAAFETLRANLAARAPGIPAEEVLIQPMRAGLAEALVGFCIDQDAGPLIMLAAGGIWAEVARDRSIRLAPVDLAGAREMVDEVRAFSTLSGLRGRPRGDLEALAQAVSALSQLALRPELEVAEAEVNPLMILPEGQGVLAVDALVLKAKESR